MIVVVRRRVVLGLILVVATSVAATAVWAGQPLFAWQVKSPTATITMLGSVHFGRPDFYPLAPVLEDAFENSDALAVEVNIMAPDKMAAAAQLMMTKGMLPPGETLATVLPESLVTLARKALADQSGAWEIYQKLRPAFLALVLTTEQYAKLGFDPTLGLESHFLALAQGQKEIIELETMAQQMALFTDLDSAQGQIMLGQVLTEASDMSAELDQLISAWKAGDPERVAELMTEQVAGDSRLADFYRRLLDDRNVAMATKLADRLAGDQNIFVLVGAGHFAGENGIIHLLRSKGLDVRQLER